MWRGANRGGFGVGLGGGGLGEEAGKGRGRKKGRPTLRDAYVRSLLPIMMTASWGPAETSPSPCLSRHIKCCAASPYTKHS